MAVTFPEFIKYFILVIKSRGCRTGFYLSILRGGRSRTLHLLLEKKERATPDNAGQTGSKSYELTVRQT